MDTNELKEIRARDLGLRQTILSSPDEGWGRFWLVHAEFIKGQIGRFRLSPEDAEEVFQEVSLRLTKDQFKLIKDWEPDRCSLRGFLSVIVTSTCLSFLRSGFHSYTKRKVALGPTEVRGSNLSDLILDSAPSPTDRLRRIELLSLFESRLEAWAQEHRIAPRDRQIVKFRLGGMSHGEIAEVLGMKPSNVAQRFSRLRHSLRRALEGAGINYLDASE